MKPEQIAEKLTPSQKRGLLSPGGKGEYSTAVFRVLLAYGLVDGNFYVTRLGEQVRSILTTTHTNRSMGE